MDIRYKLSQRTLHFKRPARTSRGEYTEHDTIIVLITDEDGKRIGLGECAPLPDLSYDRNAYACLSDVDKLINDALKSEDYHEFLRPYPALLFAIESAMNDYQQNPFLYDTPFALGKEGIPINGLIWMADYENMRNQVEDKLQQNSRCIKIKIGAINWEDELLLIRNIRAHYSNDIIQIRVDANGNFTPEEVMPRLEELAKYDIHSIEQPIQQCQWKEMAKLCKNSPIPIALDEELIGINTVEEKQEVLDIIKPQYIVVKPTLHGGITGALEWIDEAKKRNIDSWITSALEGNIGLLSVALLAARAYGPNITFPQGLGTGQLFVDNIDMGLRIKDNKLWRINTNDSRRIP